MQKSLLAFVIVSVLILLCLPTINQSATAQGGGTPVPLAQLPQGVVNLSPELRQLVVEWSVSPREAAQTARVQGIEIDGTDVKVMMI